MTNIVQLQQWLTLLIEMINNTKLSRGEICVANFIPPANGRVRVIISCHIGSKCCFFGPQPRPTGHFFGQINNFFKFLHVSW